ncbi:hypothetical protein [Pseudactinotalea sp.]|uniref:hypothetical protein n=1 Tax=Pseudactinotalea sp. TaxID=1926260 RepID=UPI003B3B4B1F
MSTDWEETATSKVRAMRGYRGVDAFRDFPLSDGLRSIAAGLVDERGRSGWVAVSCHGHDAGKKTRVRLALLDDVARLEFDTRGGIELEVRDTERDSEAAGPFDDVEGVDRWRMSCRECGRSGGRSCSSVLESTVRALEAHRVAKAGGRRHVAAIAWWG